ncbi:MAG: PAAR-like domain-containing protein [Nannocystaceae bacterium]
MAVFINGRSVVFAGDGHTFAAASPDVCKTPAPGGPVPVPYPNFARTRDLEDGSRNVLIGGKSIALERARIARSAGDEAGTAGGVVSGVTRGSLTWVDCTHNVLIEGRGVICYLEPTLANGNGHNCGGMSHGAAAMMAPSDDAIVCLHCGEPFAGHSFPEIRADRKLHEAGIKKSWRDNKAEMVGGLRVEGLRGSPFITRAGIVPGWMGTSDPVINFKTGRAINISDRHRDRLRKTKGEKRFAVGNCVEQKALTQAYRAALREGLEFPGSFTLAMGVGKKQDGSKMVPPCDTCREIMMAMLCTNPPKAG